MIDVVKTRGLSYTKLILDDDCEYRIPSPAVRFLNIKKGYKISTFDDFLLENRLKILELAKGKIVYLLSRYDYSSFELRRKLKENAYSDDIVNEAVRFFVDNKYVNDYQRVYNLVSSKLKRYGIRQIKEFLKQKGIPGYFVDSVLLDFDDIEDEEGEVALKLAKKKLSQIKHRFDKRECCNKLVSMLARKGYSYDLAKSSFEKAYSECEDEDSDLNGY